MDKKTLLTAGIIALLIGGGLVYVSTNNAIDSSKSETTKSVQTADDMPATSTQPAVAGTYIDYSDEQVLKASGTKLLFFHAPWCPQCRALDTSIKASSLPDNLTIFKVDYDSNQTLRQKYGVTIQTTIVKIDPAGEKIESYVAYGEPTFDAVERELLP